MHSLRDIFQRRTNKERSSKGSGETSLTLQSSETAQNQCPHCRGTNWITHDVEPSHPDFGKAFACACTLAAFAKGEPARRREASNLPALLLSKTFGNWESREGDEHLVTLLRSFADEPDKCKPWFAWVDGPGVGKTHLSAAVINYRIEHPDRGGFGRFENWPETLRWLRQGYDKSTEGAEGDMGGYNDRLEVLLNAPLLVLDDIGTQKNTEWAQEQLYQVLNHRYLNRQETIVNCNIEAWHVLDPRLQSRLADFQTSLLFVTNLGDFRLKRDRQ